MVDIRRSPVGRPQSPPRYQLCGVHFACQGWFASSRRPLSARSGI